MHPKCVQMTLRAISRLSSGCKLTTQNPDEPAGVRLNVSLTIPGTLKSFIRPTRQLVLGSLRTFIPKKSWNIAPNVAPTNARAPHATMSAKLNSRRDDFEAVPAREAMSRNRCAIEGLG